MTELDREALAKILAPFARVAGQLPLTGGPDHRPVEGDDEVLLSCCGMSPEPLSINDFMAITAYLSALSPKADDGWIEWSGGKCPVDVDAVVQVQFQGGSRSTCLLTAASWTWRHFGNDGDIVAYRLVQP